MNLPREEQLILMHRSIYLMLYLCSCQYLGIETHKDSVTLTRVAATRYEQHIDKINNCLQQGRGLPLQAEERQALLQRLQRDDQTRTASAATRNSGMICASYTSGTIESEQVRRCRYKLAIYPLTALKNCVRVARQDAPKIKQQLDNLCQRAKTAIDKLSKEDEDARQLATSCLYLKLKERADCAHSEQDFADCEG